MVYTVLLLLLIGAYAQTYEKHIHSNTLHKQNADIFSVKACSMYCNHGTIKDAYFKSFRSCITKQGGREGRRVCHDEVHKRTK
jgi:hypothetical protein